MQQIGFDASFQSAIANVTPNQLDVSYIDKDPLVQSIQAYQPTFQLSDLNQLLSLIPADQYSLTSTLTNLQTYGLSPTVQNAASAYIRISTIVDAASNPDLLTNSDISPLMMPHFRSNQIGHAMPAAYSPTQGKAHLRPIAWQKITQHLQGEGGGTGYNCRTDSALLLGVGTVFLVIAIMAGPAGALVYAAEWSALAFWGGSAAGAWALAHAVFC